MLRSFGNAGSMFRYERPQAGLERQFHQIGVEFLGASSARSDVKEIVLGWDLIRDLGVSGLELQINSLGPWRIVRTIASSW